MQPENVWKWLDAVDQEHLDPLDQWRVPTLQFPTQKTALESDKVFRGVYETLFHADAASPLKPTPPSGLLLRTGNIRMIGSTSSSDDVEKKELPKPLVPNSPATVTADVKREPCFRPRAPSISITPKATTGQRAHTSLIHRAQSSAKETKHIPPIRRKRLPTYLEKTHTEALQSILVEVTDPVAVECRGAKIVGGDVPRKTGNSRRHTTAAGEGALHRSNALKRPYNGHLGSGFRRIG